MSPDVGNLASSPLMNYYSMRTSMEKFDLSKIDKYSDASYIKPITESSRSTQMFKGQNCDMLTETQSFMFQDDQQSPFKSPLDPQERVTFIL